MEIEFPVLSIVESWRGLDFETLRLGGYVIKYNMHTHTHVDTRAHTHYDNLPPVKSVTYLALYILVWI